MNPTLINHIADRVRDLNTQGKTFLIVEHNMEFVMGLCSTVTVLDSGATVVSGPPEMIRTDKRVLDAYLGVDLDDTAGLDDTAEEAAVTPPAESALALEGVVAGYGGGDVLRGVTFTVPQGSITCVVGPERRGQVDRDAGDQRPAEAAPRHRHAARGEAGRQVAPADPHDGRGPGPAEPQPLPGHDRPGEYRARRLHPS